MVENESLQRPTVSFLSREGKEKIHQAVLEVLDGIGMQIFHEEALDLLKKAGCRVEREGRVRIPPPLVEGAVRSAPRNISIFDREGKPAMELGGSRAYFGTGSDLMYTLDSERRERRLCTLEDVQKAARVSDGLPNIDFIMSSAYPSDVPPHQAFVAEFQAMAENSTKPIVCTAECVNDLAAIRDIAAVFRESGDRLRQEPYFILYAEPTSPLKHAFESLDKLLYCAEAGIPAIYSPAPNAGAAAPITIAGHVVQGLAECFCGLVIHQLKAEGAPFIMGMGPAVLDMTTSQSSYNAPEYYLAYMAAIEMSHYYDLPSWGYAGTSDSQIPDGQATFEAGLLTFLSAMGGANLNHDVGYLNFGLTGSLEMMVIVDEIIDEVRRLMRGIPVDDETLGLEAIREAGPKGDFLVHPHTLRHLRTTRWRPRLFSRLSHDNWKKSGETTLLDRARQRLCEILENHRPAQVPEEKRQAIDRLVDQFKKRTV